MPGASKSTCIQGVANAVPHLVTHIGQVCSIKGHEAKGRVKLYGDIYYLLQTEYIQSIM